MGNGDFLVLYTNYNRTKSVNDLKKIEDDTDEDDNNYDIESDMEEKLDEEKEEDNINENQLNPATYSDYNDPPMDCYLDLTNINSSRPSTAQISTIRAEKNNEENINLKKNKSTLPEIRYINPAIFIERVENENEDEINKQTYRKKNCVRKCSLEVENSFIRAARLKASSASLNSSNNGKSSVNGGLTFDEWLTNKLQVEQIKRKQQVKSQKCNSDGGSAGNCENFDRKNNLDEQRENFKHWLAVKREQELRKQKQQEEIQRRQKLDKELKEQQAMEKETKLKAWIKHKDEAAKIHKRRKEKEMRKMEEQKQLRQEKSKKAFEDWMARSKYTPKPIPINMGAERLLRASVSTMFLNPTPWQENIDIR